MLDLSEFLRLLVWWLPNRKYAPVPTGQQHITELSHVTLACPRCNSEQDATEIQFERRALHGSRWQSYFRAYKCDLCNTLYNADSCADDGPGLLQVSPWPCPLCQHSTPPDSRQCANCRAVGDEPTD